MNYYASVISGFCTPNFPLVTILYTFMILYTT